MITIQPKSDKETIGIKLSGTLEPQDYDTIRDAIDLRALQDHDPVSLVIYMDGIEGISFQSFFEELGMMKYANKIDKTAGITDSGHWEILTKLSKPFGEIMGVDVKHFEPEAEEAAWQWAKA